MRTHAIAEPTGQFAWLQGETLASLAELNEQYLVSLATHAASSAGPPAHPLYAELRPLLKILDADSLRRAAQCPYLLADVGFAEPQRWQWARSGHVRDVPGAQENQCFALLHDSELPRLVFTYAWHLARAHRTAARVLLGMATQTAETIATYTLRHMTDLASTHPNWLQPRWPMHMRMWRELLGAALKGDGPALEQARMRGVQLLAAEARSASANA